MAITFNVEPFENGRVVYLRVAPPFLGSALTGMLYFYIDIQNPNAPVVTLTKIDVSFPMSSEPGATLMRNQKIGESGRVWLTDAEVFKLTKAPTQIKISLTFDGMNTPEEQVFNLGPHLVSYQFFAHPEKIEEFGEYIVLKKDHLGNGGPQHFAQDAGVLGWRDGELSASKMGLNENTDRFLFGRPFYAMGDGLVLAAEDSNEDNPAPGKRTVKRMKGTFEGKDQINDIAVACFRRGTDDNLILIASATARRGLTLTALKQTDRADTIIFLNESLGPRAEKVALISLNDMFAVTATQLGTNVRVTLWEIAPDASMVEIDHFELTNASAVKLLKLSATRLVTAVRGINGVLSLSVWELIDKKFKTEPIAGNTVGPLGVFDLAALNQSSFVTAVQQNGNLKVIAWNLNDLSELVQAGDDAGGSVSEIAAVDLSDPNLFGTAVRQNDGTMKFIVWMASNGDVTRKKEEFENGEPSSLIKALPFKGESVAVLSRTGAGRMHLAPLDIELSEETGTVSINLLYDEAETSGTTDLFCAAQLTTPQPTVVTVVRTTKGVAKVILWQYTYSNFIRILYGNEIVTCVHLKQGSIPAHLKPTDLPLVVTRGEMIGRMGHSGKSSGPHLHIQADRVKPNFLGDLPALMQHLKEDKVEVSDIRPLQFHGARAMLKNDNIQPGGVIKNPLLGPLVGYGIYFNEYVVLPEPV